MRTALDTNVLSALWSGEPSAPRLAAFLDEAAETGGLVIHPVVYIESRAHPHATGETVRGFLDTMRVSVDWVIERDIWQLAAERFEGYARRRQREGVAEAKRLPADFLIAAHAVLRADRLVTLDQRRYRADFPELRLVEL